MEDRLSPDQVIPPERVAEIYRDQYADRPIIRHILVAEQSQARRVLERLAAGEDFAALATELSLDTQTARRGGDLGPHLEDAFVAPFEEAIENARNGQTVGPVQTPFGYHIIERRPPAELTEASNREPRSVGWSRSYRCAGERCGTQTAAAALRAATRTGSQTGENGGA